MQHSGQDPTLSTRKATPDKFNPAQDRDRDKGDLHRRRNRSAAPRRRRLRPRSPAHPKPRHVVLPFSITVRACDQGIGAGGESVDRLIPRSDSGFGVSGLGIRGSGSRLRVSVSPVAAVTPVHRPESSTKTCSYLLPVASLSSDPSTPPCFALRFQTQPEWRVHLPTRAQ